VYLISGAVSRCVVAADDNAAGVCLRVLFCARAAAADDGGASSRSSRDAARARACAVRVWRIRGYFLCSL